MICLTGVVCMYYNVIIAWTLYYLLYSFFPTIPWSTCDNDFNTNACYQRGQHLNVSSNYSDTVINITRKTTTEEFWEYVQYTANNKLNGICYNTHIAKSEHFQNLKQKSKKEAKSKSLTNMNITAHLPGLAQALR